MVITDKDRIEEALSRRIDAVYPSKGALERVLLSGKRLRIYLGIDPTGPSLHLGHASNLLALKKFQELGHEIILLVGDFTAMIGDPTGKLSARKQLSPKEVKRNMKTFKKQAGKLISFSGRNSAKLKFNSKWLGKLTFSDVVKLAAQVTVGQMLKRDMFQKRMEGNKEIYLHEFLYPLMQGYDAVAMDVDMELGGSDQTFNMLIGRDLMRKIKDKEKFVITTKLLENPKTGEKLMNKSEGGLVNLDDKPADMFGKIMALDDEVMFTLAEFSSEMPMEKVRELERKVGGGMNPRDAKLVIAREIVALVHGDSEADKAREEFIKIFSDKELPDEMPEIEVGGEISLVGLLMKAGVKSKSEARRLIIQNAVKINDEVHSDIRETLFPKSGDVLKVGKHHFYRLTRK